jgi:hypothetical protein
VTLHKHAIVQLLCAAAATFALVARADDVHAELNRMLEENAASAAYALACGEEPMADQLKANTMMLLVVNGIEAHNVQLGSAKFNDVMRRQIAGLGSSQKLDCTAKVREARERLTTTQDIIRNSHRDEPSSN